MVRIPIIMGMVIFLSVGDMSPVSKAGECFPLIWRVPVGV